MHVIRLREPWQSRSLPGVVCCRRSFHKPTGLEPAERVWLVVESLRFHATVRLNGRLLGDVRHGTAAARFDITELLADRNALEVDVEHEEAGEGCAGQLAGKVWLEIA